MLSHADAPSSQQHHMGQIPKQDAFRYWQVLASRGCTGTSAVKVWPGLGHTMEFTVGWALLLYGVHENR
jgi:hypothetical protein